MANSEDPDQTAPLGVCPDLYVPKLRVMTVFMLRCFISDLFDNYMQQDAHEFLNYLLNRVAELLQGKKTDFKQQQTSCYMKELENNDIHDMYNLNRVAFLLNERSKLQMFRNKL